MRTLSTFVLGAGMLLVLAVPMQSSASSIQLNPLEKFGADVACVAGAGISGNDVCTAPVGAKLSFGIVLVIDAAGTNAWSIDLAWDQGLEDALTFDALNPVSSLVLLNPTPPPVSITYTLYGTAGEQQSSNLQEGHIYAVTQATAADLLLTASNVSFRTGTITFTVQAGGQPTAINSGFFRTDGAAMGSSASAFITPTFGSWTINQESIPEPSSGLLLACGLLVFAGRSMRRRNR